MIEPSVTQPLIDAFARVRDSRQHVQWLSSLQLADFLLRGGTVPDDLLNGVIEGLRSIMDSDADSERHLFSCMSLMLLGQTDAERHLNNYMKHESGMFRANAEHVLNLDHE